MGMSKAMSKAGGGVRSRGVVTILEDSVGSMESEKSRVIGEGGRRRHISAGVGGNLRSSVGTTGGVGNLGIADVGASEVVRRSSERESDAI